MRPTVTVRFVKPYRFLFVAMCKRPIDTVFRTITRFVQTLLLGPKSHDLFIASQYQAAAENQWPCRLRQSSASFIFTRSY